jgi:hypothetical protein
MCIDLRNMAGDLAAAMNWNGPGKEKGRQLPPRFYGILFLYFFFGVPFLLP